MKFQLFFQFCLAFAAITSLLCLTACGPTSGPTTTNDPPPKPAEDPELVAKIENFCGACHVMPLPSSFPKRAWHDEVERGFEFFNKSDRNDLDPPPMNKVVEYFRSRAPENLELANNVEVPNKLSVSFSKSTARPADTSELPAISNLHLIDGLTESRQSALLACDMRTGQIGWSDKFSADKLSISFLSKLNNPCHVERCQLVDGFENQLVVADLGSFFPKDHDDGRVVWLDQKDDGSWQQKVLFDRIGRVADVQCGDFNGDSREDLIVAEFGWFDTGSVWLLTNESNEAEPAMKATKVDKRSGAIHVPTCDLNGDNNLDFIALISQEYETIVAYLGDGEGNFDTKTIWESTDPAYGSTGIQLIDFDGDEDLDILFTNGDSFDSFFLKPYHSIQWLENRGDISFVHHHLAAMPGVHRALAGDIDGDKDLDIVAVALLLPRLTKNAENARSLDSIICLEQVKPGEFRRHSLEVGVFNHATLEMGDFDGDQDLDLAVGEFVSEGDLNHPWMTIWWNDRN